MIEFIIVNLFTCVSFHIPKQICSCPFINYFPHPIKLILCGLSSLPFITRFDTGEGAFDDPSFTCVKQTCLLSQHTSISFIL